jgi:predicted ester cyclase
VTAGRDLRERREALVREHMESENRHDFELTLGTFGHPRYEIVPTGDVFDGEEAVRRYFDDSRTAFPDQRNELIALHHTDAGVIVEFELKGTHRGPLRGIPATGKHRDQFSFHRWARQALGPVGLALGWTPLLRAAVRRKAAARLAKFTEPPGGHDG